MNTRNHGNNLFRKLLEGIVGQICRDFDSNQFYSAIAKDLCTNLYLPAAFTKLPVWSESAIYAIAWLNNDLNINIKCSASIYITKLISHNVK